MDYRQSYARGFEELKSRFADELASCFQEALRQILVEGIGGATTSGPRATKPKAPARPRTRKSSADNPSLGASPSTPATDRDATARPSTEPTRPEGAAVESKTVATPSSGPASAAPVGSPNAGSETPAGSPFARAQLVIPVRVRTPRRVAKRTADEIAALESRIVSHVTASPGATAPAIASALGVAKSSVNWPLAKLVESGKLVTSDDGFGKSYSPAPPPPPAVTRIIRRRPGEAAWVATPPTEPQA